MKDEIITLDIEKCMGCAMCGRVCPMQLTPRKSSMHNDRLQLFDIDCIRCKTCVYECPSLALSMQEKRKEKVDTPKGPDVFEGEVKKVEKLSDDIFEISFKVDDFSFKPGQFVLIKVDSKPMFRAYSVVSYENKILKFAVKRLSDGLASPVVCSLKEGEIVEFKGPMGNFTLKDNDKLCFVAAGVGITPFVSMVKEAVKNDSDVILIHSAKTKKDLLFYKEFAKLAEDFGNFRYIPTLTRAKDEGCKSGRATAHLSDLELEGFDVYMCGMRALVDDCKPILKEKGVREFYSESF